MGRRVLVIVAALGLATAACDTGPDSYFDTLSDVTATYAADVAELPVASTDASLDEVRAFFSGVDVALNEVLLRLEQMSAPEGIENVHSEFAARVYEFAVLSNKVVARTGQLETHDDLIAMANDRLVGAANYRSAADRVVTACNDLQAAADAGNANVDLQCSSLGRE